MERNVISPAVQAGAEQICRQYPKVWSALFNVLEALSSGEKRDLLTLYAGLDCHDLLSVTPEAMLDYVRATRRACAALPYTGQIPEALFDSYVLAPRVNNEWLDGSRQWLFDRLYPRVKHLDMGNAALEVNYWCFEQATYRSTNDRTVGPMGMCLRGFGRCGEESTLLVSALRAVGVPARQCYAPYWAHCDDNHAWVEFWDGEDWHYMGACEPEPAADLGWFQSAASKAMLIRSRVPAPGTLEGYRTVNTTGRYAKTALLRVQLTEQGQPLSGIPVRFQLINYSRVQTLHTEKTDGQGIAYLETGFGSLLVSCCLKGLHVEKAVELSSDTLVQLRAEEGMDPRTQEKKTYFVQTVPKEQIPPPVPMDQDHRERLRQCEALRHSHTYTASPTGFRWLDCAAGNREQIEAFLSLEGYSAGDKELLLETLADKDFCDCTCQILESYLRSALLWKDKYPRDIWQKNILAPRVENEMLLPIRPELKALLAGEALTSGEAVLKWMEEHIRPIPEYGLTDRRGNAAGYLRSRCCPESEWHILAVQICRTLGIPAQLSPRTRQLEIPTDVSPITLTLENPDAPMTEEEHFSLSVWNGDAYIPVCLKGCSLGRRTVLQLTPGAYCLVTVRRQIDGSLNSLIHRFPLFESREFTLQAHPDETQNKLIRVPLPRISVLPLTDNAHTVFSQCRGRPSLLIYLEPGKEPTEHLLREFLSLEEAYRSRQIPIRFLLGSSEAVTDPSLSSVLARLPNASAWLCRDQERFTVQTAAGIGDGRLPLAVVLDSRQQIVYGCANYNIRTAAALLHVLSFAE